MGAVKVEVSGGDRMKKGMESLFFIAVAVLVIFSLRFALGTCERSEHEYKYADSLNLEEETKQIAEEQEETEEQEDIEEETEVEDVEDEDDTDDSDPSNTNNTSNTGNSNGGGGGDGSGHTPGDVTVRTKPTPTPIPTLMPDPSSTPEPVATSEPTEEPEDKIKSIKCSWPDKDSLLYGKSIPRDTMVVTAVYESGKEEKLSQDDYQVTGLRATVCGKHKLTVIYGDFECKLTYTVENYIVKLTYDWDSQDTCYKGEAINDDVLTVYTEMADGSEEEIPFGDYDLSGIDNKLVDKKQNFTIRYKGFEVSGTCTFHAWTVTVHNVYCSDAGYKDVVYEAVGEPQEVDYNQRIKSLGLGTEKSYKGDTYILKKEELTADGRKRPLPYNVRAREFDLQIYRYFVLEDA